MTQQRHYKSFHFFIKISSVLLTLWALYSFLNTPGKQLLRSDLVADTIHYSTQPVDPDCTTGFDHKKQLLINLVTEDGWSEEELKRVRQLLSDNRTHFRPMVLERNTVHVESKAQYEHHLNRQSLEMSSDFFVKYGELMTIAGDPFSVPPQIITAILKVESNFGAWKGKESVFNVFWSLGLGSDENIRREVELTEPDQVARLTRKAKWARKELMHLIIAMDEFGQDPLEVPGSWAGAFGLAQFIPSSYRAYGKDGDGDGFVDLFNVADAAASIANYLKENGWRKNSSSEQQLKVIMRYNQSQPYGECVLALADSIAIRNVR